MVKVLNYSTIYTKNFYMYDEVLQVSATSKEETGLFWIELSFQCKRDSIISKVIDRIVLPEHREFEYYIKDMILTVIVYKEKPLIN